MMPETDQPRIEVGLITRNRVPYVAMCLQALLAQTYSAWDLTLIDDSETPLWESPTGRSLLDMVAAAGHAWRAWPGRRGGPPISHNQVLYYDAYHPAPTPPSEYVYRLDDDILLPPRAFEVLVARLQSLPRPGAVSLVHLDGTRPAEHQRVPTAPGPHFGVRVGELGLTHIEPFTTVVENWPAAVATEHLHAWGLYRRAAMQAVGGFPTHLSVMGHTEETEASYRLFRAGYDLRLDTTVVAQHLAAPQGGIREIGTADMVTHDRAQWAYRSACLKVDPPTLSLGALGLGDQIAASGAVSQLVARHGGLRIVAMNPEVYAGQPGIVETTKILGTEDPRHDLALYRPDPYVWGLQFCTPVPLFALWCRVLDVEDHRPGLVVLGATQPLPRPPYAVILTTAGRVAPGGALKDWPGDWEQVTAALMSRQITPIQITQPGHRVIAGIRTLASWPFQDLVALVAGAALVVSVDSFLIHLADAVGTPSVGLYGPTDAQRFGSVHPASLAVTGTPCAEKPCKALVGQPYHVRDQYRRFQAPCPFAQRCLDLPATEILKAITHVLSKRPDHREPTRRKRRS